MSPRNSHPSKIIPGQDVIPVALGADDLPNGACRALLIGTAGNLNITTISGNDRDNVPVQAGIFPVQCIKVRTGASETAATNIWAIY